jgi:hypothetical protein
VPFTRERKPFGAVRDGEMASVSQTPRAELKDHVLRFGQEAKTDSMLLTVPHAGCVPNASVVEFP